MAAIVDIIGVSFDLTDANLRTALGVADVAMDLFDSVSYDDIQVDWVLARAGNADTDKKAGSLGLGINCSVPTSSGEGILILTYGTCYVTFDAASATKLVVGESYYVGTTEGEIIPYADLSASSKVTFLGVATDEPSTDVFEFKMAPFPFQAVAT